MDIWVFQSIIFICTLMSSKFLLQTTWSKITFLKLHLTICLFTGEPLPLWLLLLGFISSVLFCHFHLSAILFCSFPLLFFPFYCIYITVFFFLSVFFNTFSLHLLVWKSYIQFQSQKISSLFLNNKRALESVNFGYSSLILYMIIVQHFYSPLILRFSSWEFLLFFLFRFISLFMFLEFLPFLLCLILVIWNHLL